VRSVRRISPSPHSLFLRPLRVITKLYQPDQVAYRPIKRIRQAQLPLEEPYEVVVATPEEGEYDLGDYEVDSVADLYMGSDSVSQSV